MLWAVVHLQLGSILMFCRYSSVEWANQWSIRKNSVFCSHRPTLTTLLSLYPISYNFHQVFMQQAILMIYKQLSGSYSLPSPSILAGFHVMVLSSPPRRLFVCIFVVREVSIEYFFLRHGVSAIHIVSEMRILGLCFDWVLTFQAYIQHLKIHHSCTSYILDWRSYYNKEIHSIKKISIFSTF